jgi:carbon-monoxide dehydrogenase large subunit
MKFGIGQPVRRKEDARFLTGRGRYVDDIAPKESARAVVLRSPVAHAILRGVDAKAARAAPGVLAVYVGADVEGRLAPLRAVYALEQTDGSPAAPVEQPHLALGKLRYVGEPVAFVVAETVARARDAAEMIEIDYEELPAVVDPLAALAPGAPLLHDCAPDNRVYRWEMGDAAATDAAFAAAAHVASVHVVNQRVVVASMEPRACAARYDGARWEVWMGTQGSHGARARLCAALGVEPARIRVHTPDVGGGFGMKLMAHPEHALTLLAAQDLGCPVKWIGERSESMLSDAQGRDLTTEAEAAFDADGRLLAFRWRSVSGLGAYLSTNATGIHTAFSAPIAGTMYRLPALHLTVEGALSNTPPTDAYRGAGRPEVNYVTERLMSEAARGMGVDPVELRLKNLLTPGELPYDTAGGMTFDSLNPPENIRRLLAACDREGFPARRTEAARRGRLLGFGLAYYMERTGGGPSERALVTLAPDGEARIDVGTQSTGQGHETAWAQLVHEKLGVDFDRIRLAEGDSDALPLGGGTGGSRSLIMAGRVLLLAADDIVTKAKRIAAERLEAAEADIEFSAADGGVFRIAGTDRTLTLTEIAAEAGGLTGEGAVDDRFSTHPNGAHAAEVEIDPDTGALRIARYTIVDDFGRLLNPMLVEGQVHGGVAQGLGQAVMEAARWDPETGQPLTASLMDYALPRAVDAPSFRLQFNEDAPTPSNPLGAKGCGEAGSVAAIPAITLAAHDALISAGAEPIETPLTPERLWRALSGARVAAQ